MKDWILIIGLMLVTFIPRYLPIALAGKFKIPTLLQQALEFVPIAVLTAIIAQTSLVHNGEIDLSVNNYYLYGISAAILTAWFTKQMFTTIIVGLCAYGLAFFVLT